MKKIIIALVALFTMGTFSADAQKIGHLDYIAVMDSLETYKTALKKSEELTVSFEETMLSLQTEYETKLRDYQENINTLPAIIKQTRERELGDIQLLSEQLQAEYQQGLQTIQERYYVPLEKWLKQAVAIVGKARSLDYVLYYDEESSIFWVNPERGVNVTNEVITEMLKLEKADPVKTPGE